MVFLASFVVFLLFVLAMSLSLILKRKPLMSEEEATASIMEDGACATCQQMCAMAGKAIAKKTKKCASASIKDVEIPHQSV